jgi:nucleoside-diphosphate-sugar epimerase
VKSIFVTGGAGYVGSKLVLKLLSYGHKVTVYDLFLYGDVFQNIINANLIKIRGDIRNIQLLTDSINGHEIVIHLACISNDPSFELNPKLGKEINYDCFRPMVENTKKLGIQQFIYASSSSVYGINNEKNVSEDMPLLPLTDYSKYKADCEKILLEYANNNLLTTILRPATVCGNSPRLRLDVVVNILTNYAYFKKEIKIFGGKQLRPNIHIDDMVDAYIHLINNKEKLLNGEIYNVGHKNFTVEELALIVKSELNSEINLIYEENDDNRSYHITSKKIKNHLGFVANRTISTAVAEIKNYFEKYHIKDTFNNDNYYNIRKMMKIKLK